MLRKLWIALALSAAIAAEGATQIVWLEDQHNFGAFSEDLGSVECVFKAVNVGTDSLIVYGARANCGCTVPSYTRKPVAPGDTLYVSVRYDASGRPGRFEKMVYVSTNTTPSKHTLTIRGTVIGSVPTLSGRYPVDAGAARLDNTVVPFGETNKGHVNGRYLRGYNASSHTIRPAVSALPSYINAIVEPGEVPPGEQFVVSLTARTDRTNRWGTLTDSFVLTPDPQSDTASVRISTAIIVREDFSSLTPEQRANAPRAMLSTDKLDFGTIDTASDRITRNVRITNGGKRTLNIRSVSSPSDALTLKVAKNRLSPGKSADIRVTLDPEKLKGHELLNARITIITDDPLSPVQIVRTVGEVLKTE